MPSTPSSPRSSSRFLRSRSFSSRYLECQPSRIKKFKLYLIKKASIAINSLLPEIKKAEAGNSVVESNHHNLTTSIILATITVVIIMEKMINIIMMIIMIKLMMMMKKTQ